MLKHFAAFSKMFKRST